MKVCAWEQCAALREVSRKPILPGSTTTMSGFPTFHRAPNLFMKRRRQRMRKGGLPSRKFRREMNEPDRSRELDFLAALSHQTNLSLGCYCEEESRCHRSVLRALLVERGADVV